MLRGTLGREEHKRPGVKLPDTHRPHAVHQALGDVVRDDVKMAAATIIEAPLAYIADLRVATVAGV